MTKEEVEMIGKATGEQTMVFLVALKAMMRSTPNFAREKFVKEIEAAIKNQASSDFQKEMFKSFISN